MSEGAPDQEDWAQDARAEYNDDLEDALDKRSSENVSVRELLTHKAMILGLLCVLFTCI